MTVRHRTSRLVRLGSTGIISGLGVLFAVVSGHHLLFDQIGIPELVLGVLGTGLGAVLVVGGVGLHRSDYSGSQLARIAGWATLGTVLLGLVLALIWFSGIALTPTAAATLLSVSTFAHVLIGLRDVQRIRARALARKRERLSVLNRLVRHNLRHEAQRLLGVEAALAGQDDPDEALSGDVEAVATRLSEMHERLERSQTLLQDPGPTDERLDLAAVVRSLVDRYEADHPDLTLEVDLPDAATVPAVNGIEAAVEELLDNAVAHADSTVQISLSSDRPRRSLVVEDDGPGMPAAERDVVMREAEIDQLSHSQGLGLWFVRWVMDTYDGALDIDADQTGTRVELSIPA